MDTKEKMQLIERNTQEIVTRDELESLLKKKKKPVAYIGMACTGKVHLGYFIPMMKIRDFLHAGFHFKILLADLHAHLDDRKAPFELLDKRVLYYKKVFQAMLDALQVKSNDLEYVKGSDFQLQKKFTTDMYRLAAQNTLERVKRAAAGVVRFGDSPKLSGFMYPILQALDEEYLEADVQYGGIDQRKILMFARENLPKLGYKPRIEVMTPLLPGISGEKMSASDKKSKIDIIEESNDLQKKIRKAYCPEGVVENNGILAFYKQVIMVLKEDHKQKLEIKRPKEFGGNVSYAHYDELEKDFVEKKLHPKDLKQNFIEEIEQLLIPIRKSLSGQEKLIKEAYPEE